MTLSKIGRILTALVASAALGLGMTACGGGTIGYLWVLGTYYNQISGFKIDDYTGNLTAIDHSPFTSGGTNPQMLVVKPGGRFVYVVNSGTGSNFSGSSIAVFAVGGGGELTFQNLYAPQGTDPIYLSFDSTGNYLYVLSKYSPDGSGNGAITAFSVASDTGELTVVPNNSVLNSNGTPTYFFDVSPNPIMTRVGSGNCLYTLSPQSILAYTVNSSTGSLTVSATGAYIVPGATSLTSINTSNSTSGTYTFLTDGGSNQIYTLQAGGTACSLQQVSGSQQTNVAPNVVPVNSITAANGKWLYVINHGIVSTTQTTASSISAYTIQSNGQLQALSDGTNNPYAVGSGPVCIVEDPSSQYFYISNFNDSTVTGKLLNASYGYLADLQHGSSFPATTNPTCLAVSGNL